MALVTSIRIGQTITVDFPRPIQLTPIGRQRGKVTLQIDAVPPRPRLARTRSGGLLLLDPAGGDTTSPAPT